MALRNILNAEEPTLHKHCRPVTELNVKVRAQDRYGEWFEVEGTGLTARCFCHELDHLEGIVFTSRAERMLTTEELESGEFE